MPGFRSLMIGPGLEIFDFEVLSAICETGSFRKAASRLGVGQSAVSRRVMKIEEFLGVSIFERHRGGARMTAAGASFIVEARHISSGLVEMIEAARSAGRGEKGRLRVGIIASLSRGVIRAVIERFRRDHPNILLSLIEADRGELFTLLSHREMDVVIAAGMPQSEYGDGMLLHREPIYLAVSDDHPFARCKQISWSDLSDSNFIASSMGPGPEIHDYITRSMTDLGRMISVTRCRLGREGIMNLVGLGFGVSLVADHWRGVSYPNVSFVRAGEDNEQLPFSVTWKPENDNPALRRFLSVARSYAQHSCVVSAS